MSIHRRGAVQLNLPFYFVQEFGIDLNLAKGSSSANESNSLTGFGMSKFFRARDIRIAIWGVGIEVLGRNILRTPTSEPWQEVSAASLDLLLRYPLSSRFDLHSGAGIAYFEKATSVANPSLHENDYESTGLNLKFGLNFYITQSISAFADIRSRFMPERILTSVGFGIHFWL